MNLLIATVIANDRPGIVSRLSDTVKSHDGSWMESSLSRLGGKFAGIIRIGVADEAEASLVDALEGLAAEGITVTLSHGGDQSAAAETPATRGVIVRLVANDRPGIIEEISALLAGSGVNVEKLTSQVVSAPMSADELFQAEIVAGLPADLGSAGLQALLEDLSPDLGVEVGEH